jgi:hypothetical protein
MMHGAIEYYNSLAIRSDINSFEVKDYWKRFGSFFPDHADDILNAYFRENFKMFTCKIQTSQIYATQFTCHTAIYGGEIFTFLVY